MPQVEANGVLDNLIQTTELFDQKNSEYMVMEQKTEASKKVTPIYCMCTYLYIVEPLYILIYYYYTVELL